MVGKTNGSKKREVGMTAATQTRGEMMVMAMGVRETGGKV